MIFPVFSIPLQPSQELLRNIQPVFLQFQLIRTYSSRGNILTSFLVNNLKFSQFQIYDRNLMRRNMIYFFYWGNQYPKKYFLRNLHESMKVIVIWNSKNGT